MTSKNNDRFDILSEMALAASRGDDYSRVAQVALQQAAAFVGLTAAAVFLWDEKSRVTLQVAHAASDTSRDTLLSLEEDLFTGMRKQRRLMSAYLSFAGEPAQHSFTMPLQYGSRVFGAVIGLQEGEKTLINEDVFLETFSAILSLNIAADSAGDAPSRDILDKERLAAVIETAVTVNHEINNPLTAILGNVQLLLLKREDLDQDLKNKLRTIEESAMKIKNVTQRLMNLRSARSIEYSEGTQMLDLSDEDEQER